MADRNITISIMKGLAIIFMVMGHSWTGSVVENVVGMFHMPLFFFVAGYCLKDKYFDQKATFVRKRMLGIYVPLMFWTGVFIALNNFLVRIGVVAGHSGDGFYSFDAAINRFARVAALRLCTEDLIGGYWFLPTFLVASCVSLAVCYWCKRAQIRTLWALPVMLGAALLFKAFQGRILYAWELSAAMFGAFFYVLGYVCKLQQSVIRVTSTKVLLFLAVLVIGCIYWRSGMTSCSFVRMPLYAISAFAGILLTMWISDMLSSLAKVSYALQYVGDHTLSVLTWHMTAFKLVTAVLIFALGAEEKLLLEYPTVHAWSDKGLWLVYTVIGVVFSLLISCGYSYVKGKVISYVKR